MDNFRRQFLTLYIKKSRVLLQFVVDGTFPAVVEYHKGTSPAQFTLLKKQGGKNGNEKHEQSM